MRLGVVVDVDGPLGLSELRHPVRAFRRRALPVQDQRSVMGAIGVVRMIVRAFPDTPVVYLTTAPAVLAPAIRRALRADGYPPGIIEGPGSLLWAWRSGGRHDRDVLRGLLDRSEPRAWVLLGHDGEDDPELFADAAAYGDVVAIALHHIGEPQPDVPARVRERAGGVPVFYAATGEELIVQLAEVLGIERHERDDWFLTGEERGNPATAVRAWTEGNTVRARIHGRSYMTALAESLDHAGDGAEVLLAGWRTDVEQLLDERPVGAALAAAARRGALVRGLVWRSHSPAIGYSSVQNRRFATSVTGAGGRVLLDHRVRPFGSHHQKFVVVRDRNAASKDVAFLGGIDIAASRRDDAAHHGDHFTRPFAEAYGPTPAWHDTQLELRGPVVGDVEEMFRERWADPAPLVRAPWRVVHDALRGTPRRADPLPPARPDPPITGTSAVQLLRTYPRRRRSWPFAPTGERSVARGYAKALARAERLVYVEDQYLWSVDVARVFAAALHRAPDLQLIVVVPRLPDQESPIKLPAAGLGQGTAAALIDRLGGDRVQVLDLERGDGTPIYVHSKLCIVDDVWAAVGSANLNRRSWTHDSEVTAAVLDDERDLREPVDPGGRGDGARRFARDLRLTLMREHLGRAPGDDGDLVDPDDAAHTVRAAAAALDTWYEAGGTAPRPAGRLRSHPLRPASSRWKQALVSAFYDAGFDPDARPWGMRFRRTF